MRVRLIKPIGERIRVLLKNKSTHNFKTIFPLGTELHSSIVEESKDYATLMLLKKVGWGLITVYNTESGKPEPGDMFWQTPYPKSFAWDNLEGDELHVICPNGMEWNIDSRAINCTMKNDRTHRCWVRTGIPPNITVGKKGGPTCSAGAGSILIGDYHGFLRNGNFT